MSERPSQGTIRAGRRLGRAFGWSPHDTAVAMQIIDDETHLPELRAACTDTMEILAELISMGGIGPDGPTIDELHAHVEETDGPFDDNADYHAAQLAWRTLEAALNQGRTDETHSET